MYDLAAYNNRNLWAPLDSGWVLQIPPPGWHAPVEQAPPPSGYTSRAYAPRATSYAPASGGVWACIAAHESGSNPRADTGNGYYGEYQFTMGSWRAGGGTGSPQNASPAEQTAVAQRVQQEQGWSAWPVTSRQCGA